MDGQAQQLHRPATFQSAEYFRESHGRKLLLRGKEDGDKKSCEIPEPETRNTKPETPNPLDPSRLRRSLGPGCLHGGPASSEILASHSPCGVLTVLEVMPVSFSAAPRMVTMGASLTILGGFRLKLSGNEVDYTIFLHY